ncbi:diguanylate cyclase (GGDEF) domain-containing protein [Marinobacter sp. es.048]|uniref:putative bifunctional diguanylate cyclase/phosphodiesterase n=1 Tax=Marinobacter sp. es.048 TaxID=1761795 RepID=UPI000B597A5A|nr:EAL domain-containing protein [Marinobacter sp. es.048]SNC61456.1 diguanylate cyclase (GGDEF) domain-containing protein [Marinobacter sp. es.048]
MAVASRLGFRGRLIAAMISLVALVSLVIVALLMVYLFEDEKSRAQEQLTIGERLTNEVIDRRTELELSRLSVVVQDFGFRSAIASRDPATIDSALENHSGRVGADFALLLDSQGEPMASTLKRPFPEITPEQLTSTRRNGFTRSLRAIEDKGYEVLTIPIEAPGLRAWLVTGFALDQSLAEVIARLSGTSVIFRARSDETGSMSSFAATTSIDDNLEQELAEASGDARFIEGAGYFTRITNLGESDPAAIQAVLLISRDAALQNYYQRAVEIALLVTAILIFAILLALVIARNLGRPVLQLARYARAIGEGNTPQAPAIRAGGELTQLRNALRDMLSGLREREAQIRYAATHDDVTGLGNRNALMQAATEMFNQSGQGTLVGIRLNDLSDINDTLGLEFGDKVLIGIAKRLQKELPDARILARTGGGEFLALIPPLPSEKGSHRIRQLHDLIESPLQVDQTPFSLRVTIVTMELPEDAADTNALRRRLNLTFEQAEAHPEPFTRYQPGQDESHLRELKLITDLHAAILNNGLHMNYQPKLDSQTGELVQVEALVRWIHPELGFISPEEFIFLAEQSGQIHDLTAHILERVASDARRWHDQGVDAGVAINLSAMDLTWPALTRHITDTFHGWHHDLERVTLEVTESALMEDPEEAMATLNQLRDLGVTLSVDDFGTGYSSLSQLRKLPVQELKIDKSFVLKLDTEPQDQLIVRSTIDMAHGLGLKVVAEGIENLEAWRLLQRWGCNLAQGFYLSLPVAPEDLPETARSLADRKGELTQPNPEYSE